MRNFSKTLISMAAVMAVGSAMAAGAMAAVDFSSSIEYSGDKVTFSGVTPGMSQYTLLVVQGTEGTDGIEYIISDGSAEGSTCTIKQIDQDDTGKPFTEAVVGELAEGSYKIMVGNNKGEVDSGIFTVGEKEPEVKTEPIVVGDIDMNGSLKMNDIAWLKKKVATPSLSEYSDIRYAGTTRNKADKTEVVIGDIDMNSSLKMNDIAWLKKKVATPSLSEHSDIRYAGTTVDVVVVE